MTNQITLEEALKLVEFRKGYSGEWRVGVVRGNCDIVKGDCSTVKGYCEVVEGDCEIDWRNLMTDTQAILLFGFAILILVAWYTG